MTEFAPKPGCPMCGIVSSASRLNTNFPTLHAEKEFLWRDDNFTAYREKDHPVSSQGHIIIVFNLHVSSIYNLASSDLPLLVNIKNLSIRLLSSLLPATASSVAFSTDRPPDTLRNHASTFRIGFITPPFKDVKIPVTDHLHVHAFIGTSDLAGWWRKIAYSPMAWYSIDDLIAEIRESVSNNRIKSGYENRPAAPIDMVPGAGAREGHADGTETTQTGITNHYSTPEETV